MKKASIILLFCLFLLTSLSGFASVVTVTSNADSGGTCPGTNCTLRQAIATASSGDTINFAPSVVNITLISGQLTISKNLIILSTNQLTISGNNASRVFAIDYSVTATLDGITITNGKVSGNGGGIINSGAKLTITNCKILGNSATASNFLDGNGGGIDNNSSNLEIINSTVSGNTAIYAGGIHNTGNITITNSFISGNTSSFGGGIFNRGLLTITSSNVSNNVGSSNGSGIYNTGTLTIENSTVSGNNNASFGGGVYNNGTLTTTNSTIKNNSGGTGGGIYNDGVLTLTKSTLSGNSSESNGGAIYNNRTSAQSFAQITNSTISGNISRSGLGGAIYSAINAGLSIDNSTISFNSARNGGGIFTVTSSSLPLSMRLSIVAANTITNTSSDSSPDFLGYMNGATSFFNIIGVGQGVNGVVTDRDGFQIGNAVNPINPLLGPLTNNGGPTETHALLPGSPAINTGGYFSSQDTDQRGFPRVVGGATDLGAYELQQAVACTYVLSPSSIQAGAAGGDTGFNITTQNGCSWTAQSNASWITVLTPSGTNSGRVNYSIQPNTGQTRSGTISVSGQTFTVNQDAVATPVEFITGSGRVLSEDSKSVRGALVTFTNSTTGEIQTTITNQFGYFHLTVQRGLNYSVTISHKRYIFTGTRGVAYNSSIFAVIFAADQEQ